MTVVVTRAVGATAKPVGVLYVEPGVQVLDAGSGTALADTGLDPALAADVLSSCLAHERCGVHLYRSCAARTTVDELRERYEAFGAETLEHVRILEELIAAAGGDPHYVSPAARATERAGAALVETTWVLAGSVDAMTAEVAMVEAVMLAEAKDHANWQLLQRLAGTMASGPVRAQLEEAVAIVLVEEEEHHGWATQMRMRLLFAEATGGAELLAPGEVRGGTSSQTMDDLVQASPPDAGGAR